MEKHTKFYDLKLECDFVSKIPPKSEDWSTLKTRLAYLFLAENFISQIEALENQFGEDIVNSADSSGTTLIGMAAREHNFVLVNYLAGKSAKLNTISDENKMTALEECLLKRARVSKLYPNICYVDAEKMKKTLTLLLGNRAVVFNENSINEFFFELLPNISFGKTTADEKQLIPISTQESEQQRQEIAIILIENGFTPNQEKLLQQKDIELMILYKDLCQSQRK